MYVTIGYKMTSTEFRRIREGLGLTQEQLAQALHTTRVSIARYEAGMRRISGAVQVAITELSRRTAVPMAIVDHGLSLYPQRKYFTRLNHAGWHIHPFGLSHWFDR